MLLVLILAGCSPQGLLDPRNPVTLVMWHNFGGEMQQTMDALLDEFNATAGKDEGVIVSVEAISSSAELQNALDMILNGDPGAPEMPDITTAYPRTAIKFQSKGMLANLDSYFSAEELSAYIPAFLDEGRLGDGGLYVFPFAKSTELLFVNQTLFDRFSAATGVTMDCFGTFEGIAGAAMTYHEWSGGDFYTSDSWFNLAQAGTLQQGASLFEGESLSLDTDSYRRIWDICYPPSVNGGFALYDGYSSDLSKTGDIVCSTGSSAGILFYGDTITYPDGTVEPVSYSVLPFPVTEGGKKVAIQRGNGLMVAKTDETRETAAAVFLEWFTRPEQNVRFVAETGYLPVTAEAFETHMPHRLETVQNPYIRQMLESVMQMQAEYEFFVAPSFEAFDSVSRDYEERYERLLAERREEAANGGSPGQAEALAGLIAGMAA
jgi:multiple sugar transport system substrate-binding protein